MQAASLRAQDERRALRELLAVDPTVARRLSLADLDACFDDKAYLVHVAEVIARLDAFVPSASPASTHAAAAPDAAPASNASPAGGAR